MRRLILLIAIAMLYLFVGVNNIVWGADSLTSANIEDSYMQDVWNSSSVQGVNHTYNYGGFDRIQTGYYDSDCGPTYSDSTGVIKLSGLILLL